MSDIENYIGNTPLVLIDRIGTNSIYAKLEGNNPAGSIKDRPAIRMIKDAENRGLIKKGDTLIEATSGNTGIALAMAASIRGFKIKLIMPETASIERIKTMKAYGAEVVLVTKEQDMEGARDLAIEMTNNGEGFILNQFANKSNYLVPKEYRWLMCNTKSPIINLYPDSFELDLLYKSKYWECIPILPDLEIDNVKKEVSKIDESDNNDYVKEVIIF